MRFGIMNDPYKDPIEEVRFAGNNDFDFFELTVEKPLSDPASLLECKKEFLDELSKYGLELLGHAPWYFELAHPYDRIRKAFLEESKDVIDLLADFGAEKVTFHPVPVFTGVYSRKNYRSVLFDLLKESLKSLVDYARERGVELLLENIDGGEGKFFTIYEYEELLKETGASLTLDIGHANLYTKTFSGIVFIDRFAPKGLLKHVHASDNMGGEADLHLPIGVGRIRYPDVVKHLLRNGYRGTVTLEVFSQDREYVLISRKKLEKMLSSFSRQL